MPNATVPEAVLAAAEQVDGQAALARLLGVKPPTVSQWVTTDEKRRRPVPVEHCMPIVQASGGRVKVWELRPDDWHRIWPMLVGTEGAPPVPSAAPATT